MKEQLSQLYKTVGKIVVLYILIIRFLDSPREDKAFLTEW